MMADRQSNKDILNIGKMVYMYSKLTQQQLLIQLSQQYIEIQNRMSTNQVHDSLMRIKQNQAKLLSQLRNQHSNLQGMLTTSQASCSVSPNFSNSNSLQLSKSEGYFNSPNQYSSTPNSKNLQQNTYQNAGTYSYPSLNPNYAKSLPTTNNEQLIQSKNKKIEDLLTRQRKIYEQNHILQEENQSLNQDYRHLKKMYYQAKQGILESVGIVDFVLGELMFAVVQGLMLETDNRDILNKMTKNWQQYILNNPNPFDPTHSLQPLTSSCIKNLTKLQQLLNQQYKITASKILLTKQEQITQLKRKVTNLITMNMQINKNKQQVKNMERDRIGQLQNDKNEIGEKLRKIQRQKMEIEQRQVGKLRIFQNQILGFERQIQKMGQYTQDKDREIQRLNGKIQSNSRQMEMNSNNLQYTMAQLKQTKQKLKQKQLQYTTQIQLTKRQNILIQKLTQDIQLVQNRQSPPSPSPCPPQIFLQNQNLHRQLQSLKAQYNRYRESTKKQTQSLMTHLKQVKNQHIQLIKSEQNARSSQMRYRELVAVKGTQIKLGTSVEHLWAVKEIEYGNVWTLLENIKEISKQVKQMHNGHNGGGEYMNNNLRNSNVGNVNIINEINPQLTASKVSNPPTITINPQGTHPSFGNLPPIITNMPIMSNGPVIQNQPVQQPLRHFTGPIPQSPVNFTRTNLINQPPRYISGGSGVYMNMSPNSTQPQYRNLNGFNGSMEIRTI